MSALFAQQALPDCILVFHQARNGERKVGAAKPTGVVFSLEMLH